MSLVPFSLFDDQWLVNDPFREEFFGNWKMGTKTDPTKQFSPLLTTDIVENENEFQVWADLPGVDPSDLDIAVDGNNLVMRAERRHVHETTTDKLHRLERSFGIVTRKFLLPMNADMTKATTRFANGVLTVTVPKVAELPSSSHKLTINVA